MYKLLDNTWDKFKCAYLGEERHRRQRHPDSTIPGLDLLDPKQAALMASARQHKYCVERSALLSQAQVSRLSVHSHHSCFLSSKSLACFETEDQIPQIWQ